MEPESAMSRVTLRLSIKLPWWYRARILTIAALNMAGFAVDMQEEARDIVQHARIKAE